MNKITVICPHCEKKIKIEVSDRFLSGETKCVRRCISNKKKYFMAYFENGKFVVK